MLLSRSYLIIADSIIPLFKTLFDFWPPNLYLGPHCVRLNPFLEIDAPMFTGLIEAVGTLRKLTRKGAGGVLDVDLGPLAGQVAIGDSISVNGCCLTVCSKQPPLVSFDLSPETLSRTTLASLKPSSPVNIERAMPADGRFGGHIVQGHVDGVGRIERIDKQSDFAVYTFSVSPAILDEMVVKGSVAVDGISLTVASADARGFSVAAIPVTLAGTNLRGASVGDHVNIETDIIGKIVKKQVAKMAGGKGLSPDKLAEYGF
jgi:riboflavin synthase